MTAERGPKYLDRSKLYKLEGGEEVIFSIVNAGDGWKAKRIRKQAMPKDSKFLELWGEALETARRIESGPVVEGAGSMEMELQGLYKDVRVAVARNPITGHAIKGMTLIGVPR